MNKEQSDRYNVTDITPAYDIRCDIKVLMLPMRDGVKLHTSIYFPPDFSGRSGVLLFRTPYSRTTWLELPNADSLQKNTVYILQATRGTGWSEGGSFDPAESHYEVTDAEDTLNFLAEQEFFNGNCVMFGGSYPGWVQWCAAFNGHPVLKGIAPHVAPLYGCIGSVRPGGGNALTFANNWMLSMYHRRHFGYAGVPSYEEMKLNWHLPVKENDLFAGYAKNQPFQKFIATAGDPQKYLTAHQEHFAKITIPAFISGGWFDGFREESIESFQLMRRSAATEKARNFTRMVIGPWGHAGLLNPDIFGEENNLKKTIEKRMKFLFNLLEDPESDPLPGEKPVHFFMPGENCWYDASDWPPPQAREVCRFLHEDGSINAIAPAADEKERSYISDPADPVLSGNGTDVSPGCCDLQKLESRPDVLVYTSDEFTEKFTIAGEVRLEFYASCDAPDTDFFATLSDVYPDGSSMLRVTGMIRARFRKLPDDPQLLTGGEVCRYQLTLGNTAAAFLPGHRLRIRICGQNFPEFDRNQQTGNPVFQDDQIQQARCTVYHDADHPAILTLPECPFN